ncbi:lipid-A-disaccharide synthase [Bdellovibrionota bacterium FG-2]
MTKRIKVLISAAETSSDIHAAEVLRALKKKCETLDAFGVGGPALQAQGLRTLVDARSLLAMGFGEILGRLPRIFYVLYVLVRAAKNERPDVAVVVDYPDFHFRLSRKLKRLGIPVVYYIPPKVWAWRRYRVHALRKFFARVLCVFPFEELFYAQEGVRARYVGNPLLDELPLQKTRAQAREELGLALDVRVVTLMPGSRPSELKVHIPIMLEAAAQTSAQLQGQRLVVLMPLPKTAPFEEISQQVERWRRANPRESMGVEFRITQGNSAECLLAADAALVKSGTSTLEAALLGCPHAVVYRPSWLTIWIFRLFIRYKGPVGLVNLAGGWRAGDPFLAREILCEEVRPEVLSQELVALLLDSEKRSLMMTGFHKLRSQLEADLKGRHPSETVADEILALVGDAKC